MDENNQEILVSLDSEFGLHARPAALLAREAQKFSSDIWLGFDGREVDAKSILDILTLAAPNGSTLRILARGSDAQDAVRHIRRLIMGRFEEKG
ncbi:HPr family phosphocarrier protein [Desulfonatronovibrio hydrogenovorans]|uniref:HPr family phosphocarrier protein n=1 Tax=Desulfonatronovibrio hydrogenovorans TaxID=53245 RepID=UPI000A8E4DB3|nr:HPr family phosphocarrier protein [Desulfonatronovibrio hydrogenovorans]